MSSVELTGWMALLIIKAEEREEAYHRSTAQDGEVVISGRDEPDDDQDETDAADAE
jgi:hypothetical protein